jgi:hypothetical protein
MILHVKNLPGVMLAVVYFAAINTIMVYLHPPSGKQGLQK